MKFLTIFKSQSLWALLSLALVLIGVDFRNQRWEDRVIDWDIAIYYDYLPATFIHHDLTLAFLDKYQRSSEEVYYFETAPNGTRFLKMTMGMAILYSPFFYIAHTYTQQAGETANGFTYHYQKAIVLSALFYVIIGLFFLRLLLLKFYSEGVTSIVLVLIVLATNLYSYITIDAAMSHAYNFSLIAVFLYYSIRWSEVQKYKYSIILGIVGGFIILIRPINILVFIFPVLYTVCSLEDLKNRVLFFLTEWKHVLIIGLLIVLVWIPQMIYWKFISGNFIFYSYGQEHLYFANPHIIEGLFSYRKGWLVYTPVMLFALLGIYFVFKLRRDLFVPTLVITILFIYVTFSWWCWWYGGGFGARSMIDFYALFALCIAAFLQEVSDRKMNSVSHVLVPVFLFLIYLNVLQVGQFRNTSIHYDSMTKEAYWLNFMKKDCIDWAAYEKTLKVPDYDKAKRGEDEYSFDPF